MISSGVNSQPANGQRKETRKEVKELVGEEEETKNWKGGILSFIVVILVFLMVLIAIVVNRPAVIISNKTKLTLDNLIENFEPKRFDGNWISHNKFAYLSEDLNIKVFSCDGLNSTTIVSNHTIIPMIGDKFQFHVSTEPNILLFEYNRVEINRHSFTAQYKLYNTMNNMVFDVMSANSFENVPLQNVQLSPDGHKVAFVDKNDIHLMDKFFEGQKDAIQITDDGVENTVYNGIADWVYEEEILQATNAMYWSPNSRFLAYIKFNDSNVDLFTLSIYEDLPHSHLYNIRYPKAGMVNPTVEVIVHDTEKNQAIKQTVPNSVKQGFVEYYIFNVKFFSDSELIVVYVNREQKKSITVITDVLTGNVNFEKEYPTQDSSAWDIPIDLDVSKSHDLYFQIWSIDNYANILAFNSKNGNIQQVTTHQFDVTEIVYVHEVSSEVFYIGTNNDPKQRHLYKKNFEDPKSESKCLTCQDAKDLPEKFIEPSKNQSEFNSSEKCLYHAASFSNNGDYYVLECLGDRIPITYIKSTQKEKFSHVYEDNERFRILIESKFLPKKSYMTVTLDEKTGETADAELYYPIEFKPADTMYPVLVFTYGSPTSQLVDYRFHVKKLEAYLTTNFNVIVASMDGRGSGANGAKFAKSVYKKLGKLEMHDQFKLAEALQNEVYTNDEQFAVWGWSYGGYLSALSLLNKTTPFQCGISGAPVTDWLLYNTAYTERYMGLVSENRKGYDDSSLLEFAKRTAGFNTRKSMLLVHGTGDDNVHFQNSAVLANELRKTNLDLDFEVYPNDRHTPSQDNQRVFFKKMTRFLLNCYNIDYKEHLEALNLHHLIKLPSPPPEE